MRQPQQTGADAVHPGYGFLAESPDFAEAVEAAGLPSWGRRRRRCGRAATSSPRRSIASEAGVPVVPHGRARGRVGYPLVVKAAAGGGGRGMRVVRDRSRARRGAGRGAAEGGAAFGDDRVFCERYVERPRHVEIQLLADAHGTVVALGERECSIQRRHQKVLEETPSPAIDEELRQAMSDAAVAFAQAPSATAARGQPSSCSTAATSTSSS